MQRRKLTGEELKQLAPFEANMKTAVESDWTRGIGRHGIATMKAIRDSVLGKPQHVNTGCPSCVLSLVREVGRWYFSDKDSLVEEAHEVASVEAPAAPVEPVEAASEVPLEEAPEEASEAVLEVPVDEPVEEPIEEPVEVPHPEDTSKESPQVASEEKKRPARRKA